MSVRLNLRTMDTLTDTEMMNWLENPLSQQKLFGNFVMGGSPKSLHSAIAFAMGGSIKDEKPRSGDAVAAALHFAVENAEMKKLLKWVYNEGVGREVFSTCLDGSDSEQFLEIKRISES